MSIFRKKTETEPLLTTICSILCIEGRVIQHKDIGMWMIKSKPYSASLWHKKKNLRPPCAIWEGNP